MRLGSFVHFEREGTAILSVIRNEPLFFFFLFSFLRRGEVGSWAIFWAKRYFSHL